MKRSRSSNDVPKLKRELNLSEEILSETVDGATEESIDNARKCIERHENFLDALRTANSKNNYGAINKQIGSFFAKKNKLNSPLKTRMSLTHSKKFPIDAFTAELSNPDLFSEVYPMAFLSAAIFALAEVRRAARNGKIDDEQLDIISTPVTSRSILKAFERNQSYFQKKLKGVDYELMLSISRNTDVDVDVDVNAITTNSDHRKKKALALLSCMSIEYFGDDNEETECMYMITRNPLNNRIALIFRGSITIKDWVLDGKMIVAEVKNPVSDRPSQPPTIGVHLGFGQYLHDESIANAVESTTSENKGSEKNADKDNTDERPDDDNTLTLQQTPSRNETNTDQGRDSTTDLLSYLGFDLSAFKEKQKNLWSIMKTNEISSSPAYDNGDITMTNFLSAFTASREGGPKKSRIARIMDELDHLQQKFGNYRIYISGHSLGGSLALLAGLEIAAKFGKKGQAVTAVCMASPRAGTEDFRDAVEVLEREGKMRCLSVQGRFDIVPMLPNSMFYRETKRRFCHSGFELVLRAEASKFYMRRSEKNDEKYLKRMGLALFRVDKTNERHHFTTYLKHLEDLERSLRKLHLNDFYDKFVEGNVFACSANKMTPLKVRAARGRQSVAAVRPPTKRELKRVLSANAIENLLERERTLEEDLE